LILDEATSNLDAENEAKIFEHLRDLPMLKIIVAHRQETLAMADRVLVLDSGRVVA
jgi:ATP-binding cassette subfamily B protein RaxB